LVVAVNDGDRVVIKKSFNVKVVLVDVHQPCSRQLLIPLQVGQVSHNALKMLDSVVSVLVLAGFIVVDEPLEKGFVANHHIHKLLA
jgi:hypothetical protein